MKKRENNIKKLLMILLFNSYFANIFGAIACDLLMLVERTRIVNDLKVTKVTFLFFSFTIFYHIDDKLSPQERDYQITSSFTTRTPLLKGANLSLKNYLTEPTKS